MIFDSGVPSIHSVTSTWSVSVTTAGHVDVGVAGVGRGERLLRLRLQVVVEFLGHPVAQLVEQRLDVEPGHQHAEQPPDPRQLGEVVDQRPPGAGVLDLDGDRPAVLPDRPVHLADGRGRGGRVVEGDRTATASLARGRPRAPGARCSTGSGGADSCSLVSVARYGPASSGGSAASKIDSAWPSFIAPPLSSPSTRNTWSAVRCWISLATSSADLPPIRLPRPSAVLPANPSGSPASFTVLLTGLRGTSFTLFILRQLKNFYSERTRGDPHSHHSRATRHTPPRGRERPRAVLLGTTRHRHDVCPGPAR